MNSLPMERLHNPKGAWKRLWSASEALALMMTQQGRNHEGIKMENYAISKIGNDYDQWNLYDDGNGGKFIAMINGYENAIKILNLLNGELNEN